jgi:hypothetical protein
LKAVETITSSISKIASSTTSRIFSNWRLFMVFWLQSLKCKADF